MKPIINRRSFIKSTAAAIGTPLFIPNSVSGDGKKPGANDRLNIAWVGIGSMGWRDLRSCANGNNIVALADVDPKSHARSLKYFKNAKTFKDFRVMLEEMDDKIDAVGIGTPDHTHFAVTYKALSMGKHVFVEKPLAHSLWEIRTLQKLAAEKGLKTQMGNQGHAFEGARLVKEWYQAGLIGEVTEVICWTGRPRSGSGFDGQVQTEFPKGEPLPDGLDWDLWMGPCEKKLSYSKRLHPVRWRPWWDFGCGGLGDIGCHTIDTPYWAMDLGNPTRVEVEMHGDPNMIFTPNGSVVTFKFPANAKRKAVDLKWYEGPTEPKMPEGFDGKISGDGGMIMVGTKGGIYHNGMRPNSPQLYPNAKWEEYRKNVSSRVPKTLPRVKGGIHQDWIDAIRNDKVCCSDFSYSAPMTEVIILGTLAIRSGKALDWDYDTQTIKNNPVASSLIKIGARKGWRPEDLA